MSQQPPKPIEEPNSLPHWFQLMRRLGYSVFLRRDGLATCRDESGRGRTPPPVLLQYARLKRTQIAAILCQSATYAKGNSEDPQCVHCDAYVWPDCGRPADCHNGICPFRDTEYA
jgi:hypothetical protein